MLHNQVVHAFEAKLIGVAAQLVHGLTERGIPRLGRHIVQRQVGLSKGGENAGQRDLDPLAMRHGPEFIQQSLQIALHLTEAVRGER
jgi:hypothetical protein